MFTVRFIGLVLAFVAVSASTGQSGQGIPPSRVDLYQRGRLVAQLHRSDQRIANSIPGYTGRATSAVVHGKRGSVITFYDDQQYRTGENHLSIQKLDDHPVSINLIGNFAQSTGMSTYRGVDSYRRYRWTLKKANVYSGNVRVDNVSSVRFGWTVEGAATPQVRSSRIVIQNNTNEPILLYYRHAGVGNWRPVQISSYRSEAFIGTNFQFFVIGRGGARTDLGNIRFTEIQRRDPYASLVIEPDVSTASYPSRIVSHKLTVRSRGRTWDYAAFIRR